MAKYKLEDGTEIEAFTQEELDAEVSGLKTKNTELIDKLKESKEESRQLEEAKAKAEGDNETLRRIAEERESEKREAVEQERQKFSDLLNMTKREKIDNFITGIIDEVKPADATRAKHLRRLLKSEYEFDYDLEAGTFKVSGDKVTNAEELKRHVSESEEYQYLLAGSGATGGGAQGGPSNGQAVTKTFDKMSGAELSQLRQSDPQAYQRLRDDYHNPD